MIFNTDGGANYGCRWSVDGAAGQSNSTKTSIYGFSGAQTTLDKFIVFDILNIASKRKVGIIAGALPLTGAVAGNFSQASFVWNNTADQISSINMFLIGIVAMNAGSIVYVFGRD